jgi:hypothetical protein
MKENGWCRWSIRKGRAQSWSNHRSPWTITTKMSLGTSLWTMAKSWSPSVLPPTLSPILSKTPIILRNHLKKAPLASAIMKLCPKWTSFPTCSSPSFFSNYEFQVAEKNNKWFIFFIIELTYLITMQFFLLVHFLWRLSIIIMNNKIESPK